MTNRQQGVVEDRAAGVERPNADAHVAALGQLVREARAGSFTVDELAKRAHLSSGLISQIERGQGNPSLVTLLKLGHALNLPLGAFFEKPPARRRVVVRSNERVKLVLPHEGRTGLSYELLTPDFKGSLAVIRTQVPPRWSNRKEPFVHPGEECVHVLAGCLEAWVGRDLYEMETGDSITYDCGIPHWWDNRSREPVEIISAMTPPLV